MGSKQLEYEEIWRFALAGTSCMCAAFVTNPIDVVKTRMQLESELAEQKGLSHLKNRYYDGWIKGCSTIIRDEGLLGLYKGVIPSLIREGIYSTIRLGAYEPLKRFMGARDPAHTPLWKKICAGAISGAIGSSIATPTDLVKVRMQAQGKPKEGEIPRYRSTFAAFKEIYMIGGVRTLYVGVGPTVKRAAILTATQIPAYDHTKHLILNAGLMVEGGPLHITASMVAGFVAALTTSPVDVVKTRVMNQCHITKPYSSAFDCFWKTLKTEGPLGLYKGFIPNWMRLGPHTIVTFFLFEELRRLVGMVPV
ncbi:hypothetical protein ACJMK2_017135 [Sinanodonta woodiana]|uniref:Mitochondrial substrate carrier family protein ucpB n=1 Tax=Sinanodonta woodiana TaxID=1069815 RepID=A0ABD3UVX8_SINWO